MNNFNYEQTETEIGIVIKYNFQLENKAICGVKETFPKETPNDVILRTILENMINRLERELLKLPAVPIPSVLVF